MQFTRQPASRLTSSIAALLAAAIMALSPASGFAQDATAPAAPDTVVATVGGEPITEADIAFAAEDLSQELSRMPPEERKAFLVTVLIDMKVMAKAAREAQMDQTPLFKQRLDYLEDRALRRAYFADAIAAAVTPEAVQAAYAEYVAEFQGQPEVRARHITRGHRGRGQGRQGRTRRRQGFRRAGQGEVDRPLRPAEWRRPGLFRPRHDGQAVRRRGVCDAAGPDLGADPV